MFELANINISNENSSLLRNKESDCSELNSRSDSSSLLVLYFNPGTIYKDS